MSMRTALYVRVSTDKQSESIDNQYRVPQQIAQHRGWTAVEVYGERSALDAMLNDASRRKFDLVVARGYRSCGALPDRSAEHHSASRGCRRRTLPGPAELPHHGLAHAPRVAGRSRRSLPSSCSTLAAIDTIVGKGRF